MALTSTVELAIAEMVIYIILTPLVAFLLVRHRYVGLLGWFYLLAFCGLRLGADGITIANRHKSTSSTGATLNAIGVSPLLLALAGLLHEPAHYLATTNKKTTVVIQVLFHILALTGIGISATGGSKLASPETNGNNWATDRSLRRAGSTILLVLWVLLCLYAASIDHNVRRQERNTTHTSARHLFVFNLMSMPFVGVRAVYGVVYAFDQSKDVNPTTGSFAVKFILIFLVQVIAVGCFVIGGFWSRNIREEHRPVNPSYRLVNLEGGESSK